MHILIDIRLLARGGTTGIPAYTQSLITALLARKSDHRFTLFYNAFSKENPLPRAWKENPRVTIVHRNIPNRLLSLLIRTTGLPTIETLTGAIKPDLIWSPHLDLLATTKTPRVITVHDLSFIHYPSFFSFKYHLWSWLQKQEDQAKTATHLLAVSRHTKHDIEKTLLVPAEKISVVYPGIDHDYFRPMSQNDSSLLTYRAQRGLQAPFFLFLGTLEQRKNIICIVRAFALFKKQTRFSAHKLVLAGRPGSGYRDIKKEVVRHRLERDVIFLDSVTDEERVYLYNSARAFVFTSFFEGFGFPPLEAQACGIPVASTLRGSLQETLEGTCAPCDPWRPEVLASALSQIETDESYRQSLIEKGLANARRFTWHVAAEKTQAVFEHVYEQNKKDSQ